jgi:hypothetical protein
MHIHTPVVDESGRLRFPGSDHVIDCFIGGADLEAPSANSGMFDHQLDCVVQVPRFQEQNSAKLLLGLDLGAIGDDNLPASAPHSYCIPSRL